MKAFYEEEGGVVETAEMRRLREEEEAKDMRERARAERLSGDV